MGKIKKILLPLLLIALIALIVILWGFMTLLYIIGAILLLILLLLIIPVTIDIKTGDELALSLKVAFIKIRLAPKKEKPIKLSDYRIKAFRKKRLKEQKKYLLQNKKKSADKRKEAHEKKEKPKVPVKQRAEDILDLLKYVILRGVKKFGKHLRISIYKLRIFVGGDEPDKTAVTYGIICQSVSYITKLLDTHLNVRYPGREEHRIYVGADFSSNKTVTDIHVSFRITVWQVISCALSALIGYITMPKRKREAVSKDEAKTENGQEKTEKNPAKAGTEV